MEPSPPSLREGPFFGKVAFTFFLFGRDAPVFHEEIFSSLPFFLGLFLASAEFRLARVVMRRFSIFHRSFFYPPFFFFYFLFPPPPTLGYLTPYVCHAFLFFFRSRISPQDFSPVFAPPSSAGAPNQINPCFFPLIAVFSPACYALL